MSALDTLTDGRLALARNNIGIALSDLGAVRAHAPELGFSDDECQECVGKHLDELGGLLREALEALQ